MRGEIWENKVKLDNLENRVKYLKLLIIGSLLD